MIIELSSKSLQVKINVFLHWENIEVYLFPVLNLLIKCLDTKLRTNQNVNQVLLYVNYTEKWTGMKNTGLKMSEEDQIYV